MIRSLAISVLRLLTMVITMAGLQHVVANRADAGCGDYIVYTNPADAAKHAKDHCTGPDCPHHQSQSPDAAPVKPFGCRGPHCQQNTPMTPTPTPAPKLASPVDDGNLVIQEQPHQPPTFSDWLADPPVDITSGLTVGIYHPPR